MNFPFNETISLSFNLFKVTFITFSIPWNEIVPETEMISNVSTISVDLKIIFGIFSASKTLKELLSRLELPLLKSATFA